MSENSAVEIPLQQLVLTTIQDVNVLTASSGHVSNIEGIYQLPGLV